MHLSSWISINHIAKCQRATGRLGPSGLCLCVALPRAKCINTSKKEKSIHQGVALNFISQFHFNFSVRLDLHIVVQIFTHNF